MANEEITTGNSWAVITSADPTNLDSSYPTWFGWCNTSNNRVWYLRDNTPDNAVWQWMPSATVPASFTPTIAGTVSAGSATYSTQIGRYFRVGPMVQIHLHLVWSDHTGTGDMRIASLPLQPNTSITQIGCPELQSIALPAGGLSVFAKTRSDLRLDVVASIAGLAEVPILMSASGTLQLSMTYYL